jgi:hypothetical protein
VSAYERGAIALASAIALVGLYQGANVLTDHLAAPDFPAHARFHAALGGACMILVSLLAIWIAWAPGLRRAGGGLLLPIVLLLLPVGFLAAISIVPEGSPGGSYVALAVTAGVLAAITAVLLRLARKDETWRDRGESVHP